MMRAMADMWIDLKSNRLARAIFEALKPEARVPPTPRSRVGVYLCGKRIGLRFKASDTASLRAAINSYVRFLLSCRIVAQLIDELNQ